MADIYTLVTDRIINLIETGRFPDVVCPWNQERTTTIPYNAFSGRPFNGINVTLLWAQAIGWGYREDRWLTFRQAREAGGTVRKGERSTLACLYKPMTKEVLDAQGNPMLDDEGRPLERHFAVIRGFNLFNVAQCDGLSDELMGQNLPAAAEDHEITALDHFITGCGINVVHSEAINKAYYIPAEDRVQLPARAHFHSDADYYSVALHELTHATGHASRLARPGITQQHGMQSPQYAFEELIAQLGSAFLCGHFGIHNESFDAAYLSHWLQILKADKYAIFRASGAARRASEYLKQAYQEQASTLAVPAPSSSVITLPSQRIEVDDQDVELFGHQWPLGDHIKLDSTVDRGTFRAQVSRLKQLGYHFDAASQTWNTTALAA